MQGTDTQNMTTWKEKYRPKTLSGLVGNAEAIFTLRGWAQSRSFTEEPVLFVGPPGTGKTSAAYALATEMDWNVVEFNASDVRTKSRLEHELRRVIRDETPVSQSGNHTKRTKGVQLQGSPTSRNLVLLDEVDSMHGNEKTGGYAAIQEVVEQWDSPLIMTANEKHQIPRSIRQKCKTVAFGRVKVSQVKKRLDAIIEKEEIDGVIDGAEVSNIAKQSGGDVRSALIELESRVLTIQATEHTSTNGATPPSRKSVPDWNLSLDGSKHLDPTIFDLLNAVFAFDSQMIQTVSKEIEKSPTQQFQWIIANAVRQTSSEFQYDIVDALETTSRYYRAAKTEQDYYYWRFLMPMIALAVERNSEAQRKGDNRSEQSHGTGGRSSRPYQSPRQALEQHRQSEADSNQENTLKHLHGREKAVGKAALDVIGGEDIESEESTKSEEQTILPTSTRKEEQTESTEDDENRRGTKQQQTLDSWT